MPGKFVVKPTSNGRYMFNLKASNGEVILTSQTYGRRQSALVGVEAVRRHAVLDSSYVRRTAKDGSAYFVLVASNYREIGRSETYSSARAMENGIASVQKHASNATVESSK